MAKQEEGKENKYYKYALETSRLYLPNSVGILDNDSEYKDPQVIGDKVIIRQNNVIICLLVLVLKKLDSLKQPQNLDQQISTLTNVLRNFKPGETKVKVINRNFVVWNPDSYGKIN